LAGRSGEEAVRTLAHTYRGFIRESPHRAEFVQTAPAADDPEGLAAAAEVVAVVAGVLRSYGVADELSTHAIRCVRAAVQGFAGLEAQGGFGLPDDVDVSFEHLVDLLLAGLRGMRTTPTQVSSQVVREPGMATA